MQPSAKTNGGELRFKGRDWRAIQVHEIIDPAETRFVELDTSIEDTTKLLVRSGAPNVVLIRESTKTKTVIGAFDFSDLNAYLLLVLGLSQPDELASRLAERARSGDAIPLSDVNDHLGPREEPAILPHTASLLQAMEVLGGGLHRIVITKEGSSEAVGVLSQLRLVRFFWENHQNFSATEGLYARTLRDLNLGAKDVLAINGDKPLSQALTLMHDEGITSLPVLDHQRSVVGNISHVDVRVSGIASAPRAIHSLTLYSCSLTPPRSPCFRPAAFTLSPRSCPSEACSTAKTHIRSFTLPPSAPSPTPSRSSVRPALTGCGSSKRRRLPGVSLRAPALTVLTPCRRSRSKARLNLTPDTARSTTSLRMARPTRATIRA